MPIIPQSSRLGQDDHEFKTTLNKTLSQTRESYQGQLHNQKSELLIQKCLFLKIENAQDSKVCGYLKGQQNLSV